MDGEQRVIAHALNVREDGSREELAVVADEKGNSDAAAKEVGRFLEKAAAERPSQQDGWRVRDRANYTYVKEPVGKLRITSTTKTKPNSSGHLFGLKQRAEMIPGSIVDGWGGDLIWEWGNDRLELEHDYSKYRDGPFQRVHEDEPESGTPQKSYGVTLGASGSTPEVGFSWSVTEQMGALDNLSDTHAGDLRWVMDLWINPWPGGDSGEHQKIEHIPGSSVLYSMPDEPQPIVEMRHAARFKRFQGNVPPAPSKYRYAGLEGGWIFSVGPIGGPRG